MIYIYIYSGHRRVWSVSPYYPLWLYPVLHAHEDSCSEETMKLFFLSLARDGSWARSDIWHLRVWALTWVYQDHFQRVGVCHNVLQPQWYTAILTTSIWGEFMGFIVWKKQTTSLVLMLSDYHSILAGSLYLGNFVATCSVRAMWSVLLPLEIHH